MKKHLTIFAVFCLLFCCVACEGNSLVNNGSSTNHEHSNGNTEAPDSLIVKPGFGG